jgi:hypothetical protein
MRMDTVYEFGPFRLDIDRNPLPGRRANAGWASGSRRPTDAARAPGAPGLEGCPEQAAWPGLFVEEGNLTVHPPWVTHCRQMRCGAY